LKIQVGKTKITSSVAKQTVGGRKHLLKHNRINQPEDSQTRIPTEQLHKQPAQYYLCLLSLKSWHATVLFTPIITEVLAHRLKPGSIFCYYISKGKYKTNIYYAHKAKLPLSAK